MQPQDQTQPAPATPAGQTKTPKPANSGMGTRVLYVIGALVLIFVLSIAIYYIFRPSNTKKTNPIVGSVPAQPVADVSISSSGFNPATISVKVGQAVKWTNTDTAFHQVASDPYPKDDALAGFKLVKLGQNDAVTYIFSKAGTFTYHDELNPYSLKGTVVVK